MIGSGKQGPRVWRQAQERHQRFCLKRSVKYPASLLVWGCVCTWSWQKFITAGTMLNAAVYVEIVDTHLIESLEKLFPDGEHEFIFQHDLAPAHRAKKTKEFLEQRNIKVLEWASNSPDLIIIEFVWQVMKKRVQEDHPRTVEELKATLRQVWESFTAEKLDDMITSMPRRIQAMIRSKGDATRY